MKKLKYKIILMISLLFIIMIPTFSNAAKVSVGKVKNLKVTTNSTYSIGLSWNKVSNATGYKVYVYNASRKKYEYNGKAYKKTTYNLKNLKSAQEYKIKIRAYRTINNKQYFGSYSDIKAITIPEKVKNVKITNTSNNTVKLSWNKVAGATAYKVYLYNEKIKKYEQKTQIKTNYASITGLDLSSTQKITIRAYKKFNNKKYYGGYSDIVTTALTLPKVVGLKLKSSSVDEVTLTWNSVSNVAGYEIYKYNSNKKIYEKQAETTKNEYTISKLNPSTEYIFKVRVYKALNNKSYYGEHSEAIYAKTLAKNIPEPKKVSDLKVAEVSTNYIVLKWSKIDSATGYDVYLYSQKSQSFKKYQTTTSNSIKITDLDAAKFYKMYVKSYITLENKNYYSEASNIISQKTNSTKNQIAGIDVSAHQANIDWGKVKKAGVDFAILRCGYGQNDKKQDDKYFTRNIKECERLNIPYGVYIYSYALNTKHADSEADHALRLLKGHKPKYGVWFDMEDADGYKKRNGMPTNKELVDICVTFCEKLIKNGYDTGIYASLSWLNNQLNDSKLDKYEKWVAQWNDQCSYTKDYIMWQYSSTGMIEGIKGDTDLDILYIKTN